MPQDLSRTTLQERAHLWARTLGLLGRLVFEGKPSYFGNGEVREHLVLDDHMVELCCSSRTFAQRFKDPADKDCNANDRHCEDTSSSKQFVQAETAGYLVLELSYQLGTPELELHDLDRTGHLTLCDHSCSVHPS